MKGLNFNSRSSFLSICLSALLLLASCQEASIVDRSTVVQTLNATVVQTLNGKVMVKLEPHGSVRARVFEGEKLQYEFILDRETQQKLLTQNIDRANVYLVGKHGKELVIDDLKTQKRFVLSMFDQESKFKNIPSVRTQAIVIKGYSVSLID